MDKILISDLKTQCIIGILPLERTTPQTLSISLKLECDLRKAGHSGDLRDTVDYYALSHEMVEFVKKRKASLLEELGEELCAFIFSKYAVSKIKLRLIKPEALPESLGCGIEICRKSNDF